MEIFILFLYLQPTLCVFINIRLINQRIRFLKNLALRFSGLTVILCAFYMVINTSDISLYIFQLFFFDQCIHLRFFLLKELKKSY